MEKDYYKTETGITVYDVLEKNDLYYGFYLGNIIKYIMRSDRKDDSATAFEKAFDYLSRYIRACFGEMSLENFIEFTKKKEYNKILESCKELCVAHKLSSFVDYVVGKYNRQEPSNESKEVSFDNSDIEVFKDLCIRAITDYVPLTNTIRDILIKCQEGKPFVYTIPQQEYRKTISWMRFRWIICDKNPKYKDLIEKILQPRIQFDK